MGGVVGTAERRIGDQSFIRFHACGQMVLLRMWGSAGSKSRRVYDAEGRRLKHCPQCGETLSEYVQLQCQIPDKGTSG